MAPENRILIIHGIELQQWSFTRWLGGLSPLLLFMVAAATG